MKLICPFREIDTGQNARFQWSLNMEQNPRGSQKKQQQQQ